MNALLSDKRKYTISLWVALPLCIFILFTLDLFLGSVHIPVDEILEIIFTGEGSKTSWTNIIWQFRMPRATTALLVGIALSVSGLQLQTLFRNPLAGPFVLGISTGASLGVALLVMAGAILGTAFSFYMNSWLIILASTIGSSLVLFLVLAASFKVRDSMTLLIIGLMFGSFTGAIVSVLQFYSNSEEIKIYLIWTMGSLGRLSWDQIMILIPVIIAGIALSFSMIKPLNTLLLSENYALSMGVNIKKVRLMIIISTSILAGSVTAFCGPIAFIGLAVPHLTRLLINTSDHKYTLPAVAMGGVITMLICDIVSQIPNSEFILPINAVTSLIGAPVVVWVLIRKKNVNRAFGK
ncbi:iron ABC transporter permease [Fulvivirga maritima]|uniref:FecCD family ABC transporter permease n=1 Tax=Fulvivirga maritima TaxID=2904247 RepID=UPI001F41D355|nr:iron ABC transporter permease [Fulvivirga maritima]UII27702.1 iron ABC transporter permease [Fulvivirga maritima]